VEEPPDVVLLLLVDQGAHGMGAALPEVLEDRLGQPPPDRLPLVLGVDPRTSIQPVGSSSPNSPERTSPSMKPTTLPPASATKDASGSRRR